MMILRAQRHAFRAISDEIS